MLKLMIGFCFVLFFLFKFGLKNENYIFCAVLTWSSNL